MADLEIAGFPDHFINQATVFGAHIADLVNRFVDVGGSMGDFVHTGRHFSGESLQRFHVLLNSGAVGTLQIDRGFQVGLTIGGLYVATLQLAIGRSISAYWWHVETH